jgi:hypothetical protein
MRLENIEAASVGIDNLGKMQFDSSWKATEMPYMEEVTHTVDTATIFVEPEYVLYWHNLWGRDADGVNGKKRFSHMLGLRAVPLLSSTTEYERSLTAATASCEVTAPTEKRLQSLVRQAERYTEMTSNGERVSRLATSTVRILFRYNPPTGEALAILHDHLLGL